MCGFSSTNSCFERKRHTEIVGINCVTRSNRSLEPQFPLHSFLFSKHRHKKILFDIGKQKFDILRRPLNSYEKSKEEGLFFHKGPLKILFNFALFTPFLPSAVRTFHFFLLFTLSLFLTLSPSPTFIKTPMHVHSLFLNLSKKSSVVPGETKLIAFSFSPVGIWRHHLILVFDLTALGFLRGRSSRNSLSRRFWCERAVIARVVESIPCFMEASTLPLGLQHLPWSNICLSIDIDRVGSDEIRKKSPP